MGWYFGKIKELRVMYGRRRRICEIFIYLKYEDHAYLSFSCIGGHIHGSLKEFSIHKIRK